MKTMSLTEFLEQRSIRRVSYTSFDTPLGREASLSDCDAVQLFDILTCALALDTDDIDGVVTQTSDGWQWKWTWTYGEKYHTQRDVPIYSVIVWGS